MKQKDIDTKDPFEDVSANSIPYEESDNGSESAQQEGRALVPHHEEDAESTETRFRITEMLGGGLIGHRFLRRNWGVFATIIFLTILYVSNRYAADQELIQRSDLQRELEEVRYRALTHNSELTKCCRQSNIEAILRQHGDSTLTAAKEPPFIVNCSK